MLASLKIYGPIPRLLAGCLLIPFLSQPAQAQLEQGGLPYSSLRMLTETPGALEAPNTLEIDAQPELELGLIQAGSWIDLPGGGRLWRLRLVAREALWMALEFKHFSLPPGATLHIYDDPRLEMHGAFGPEQHQPDGRLSVHPIQASALTLEYYEPAGCRQPGILLLDSVQLGSNLGPKSQEPRARGTPAECHTDVACEAGLAWQTLTRSIVKIEGVQNCTGVLINNTSADGTPYVLTAAHCGSLKLANFWFHWKRANCGQALLPGAQSFPNIFGSELIVESRLHDFQLVRLSATPAPGINAYYAGWDRRELLPTGVTCLHHPWGAEMKISVDLHKPKLEQVYWKIRRWEIGITESGSSGAPLFNSDQHVIGQLKGGPATCQNPGGDLFGRLALEWQLLAPFLDPLGSGAEVLAGLQLDAARYELGISCFEQPDLGQSENSAVLLGSGFKRSLRAFIDEEPLEPSRVRWLSNSRLQLQWTQLAAGEHHLRLLDGDKSVAFKFKVNVAQVD